MPSPRDELNEIASHVSTHLPGGTVRATAERAAFPWMALLPLITQAIELLFGQCPANRPDVSPEAFARMATQKPMDAYDACWQAAYRPARREIASEYGWFLRNLRYGDEINRRATVLADEIGKAMVRSAADGGVEMIDRTMAAVRASR